MLIQVFALSPRDIYTVTYKLEQLQCLGGIEGEDQILLIFASILRKEPLVNDIPKVKDGDFQLSASFMRKFYKEWWNITACQTREGKKRISEAKNMGYGQFCEVFKEQGAKVKLSRRKFQNTVGNLRNRQQGEVFLWSTFNQYRQEIEGKSVPPLIPGFIELTLSLAYQSSADFRKSPLKSAIYLIKASETGSFPLLRKDAGDIYLRYGNFQKAFEQYRLLREHQGISEPLKSKLDRLIDICECNLPVEEEPALPETSSARTHKKNGKKKKGKRPSTSNQREVQTARNLSKPFEEASSSSSKVPEKEKVKSIGASRQKDILLKETVYSEESVLPSVSVVKRDDSKRRVSDIAQPEVTQHASLKATPSRKGELTPFPPKAGQFSDFHPLIRAFLNEVNGYRDNADLVAEKQCIERCLDQCEIYGRVCEDAAWFYLRQVITPVQLEYILLEADHKMLPADTTSVDLKIDDLLNLASGWTGRAAACYLDEPMERRITPEKLKEKIYCYRHSVHKKKGYIVDKRLRSICSAYGHNFFERAGITKSGKMKNLYMERARQFFDLKSVADPSYGLESHADACGEFHGRNVKSHFSLFEQQASARTS